jgi:hypothetical protein
VAEANFATHLIQGHIFGAHMEEWLMKMTPH